MAFTMRDWIIWPFATAGFAAFTSRFLLGSEPPLVVLSAVLAAVSYLAYGALKSRHEYGEWFHVEEVHD
jgi:hypothetical protein